MVSVLLGCGTGGGGDGGPQATGDAIRVSLFRYTEDPRTRRWEPTYRVMLSRSWVLQYGNWSDTNGATAREPFRKIVRGPYLNEGVDDRKMRALLDAILAAGIEQLPHRDPAKIDLRELAELPRDRNLNRIRHTRIISVECGEFRRTAIYRDYLDPTCAVPMDHPKHLAFLKAERALMSSEPFQLSIQATKETPPAFRPKD